MLISTWITAFAGDIALVFLVPAVLSSRGDDSLEFPIGLVGEAIMTWPLAFWITLPAAFTALAILKDFLVQERVAAHLNSLFATFASVTCFTVAFCIAAAA